MQLEQFSEPPDVMISDEVKGSKSFLGNHNYEGGERLSIE